LFEKVILTVHYRTAVLKHDFNNCAQLRFGECNEKPPYMGQAGAYLRLRRSPSWAHRSKPTTGNPSTTKTTSSIPSTDTEGLAVEFNWGALPNVHLHIWSRVQSPRSSGSASKISGNDAILLATRAWRRRSTCFRHCHPCIDDRRRGRDNRPWSQSGPASEGLERYSLVGHAIGSESRKLTATTSGFVLAAAIVALFNTALSCAKDADASLKAFLKSLADHDWTTQGLIDLALFVGLG